jgi:hypothetical protein
MAGLVSVAFIPVKAERSARGLDPWAQLRRPLHLTHLRSTAVCPLTKGKRAWDFAPYGHAFALGSGPVYPMFDDTPEYDPSQVAAAVRIVPRSRDGLWYTTKVLWIIDPAYSGPVLIRGKQLNGKYPIGFDLGAYPRRELRIQQSATVEAWRDRPSNVRLRSSGCFAFQIDGLSFSRVVTFRAFVA